MEIQGAPHMQSLCFLSLNIPTPIEGEGEGGQNQPVEFHFFCLETLG